MRPNYVQIVQMKGRRVPVILRDAYTFRKDRKHHWLQKLCIRILKKLDAQYVDYTTEYDRVVFDTNDFMKKLFTTQQEVTRHFNHKTTRLLIGAEDFEKLMGTPQVRQMLQFDSSFNINEQVRNPYGPDATRTRIIGLKVEVIPWMQGILVI